MKTKNFFLFMLLASFLFISCNDDDKGGNSWSEATVEENKGSIEEEGLKMLDEMRAMEDEPAIETNAAFIGFLDQADPFEMNEGLKSINLKADYIFGVNYALADFNGEDVNGIFKSITLTSVNEDPETVQALYDELVGVYSWNSNMDYWEYVKTGSVIRFEFPSTETGTTNDASYVITFLGYTGTVIDPELEGNLPLEVSAELKVGSDLYTGFYLDVVYNADGYPTLIETSLIVGEFKMEAKASNNNNTQFETSYTFTHNEDILMNLFLGVGGNWNKDNIEDNVSEETRYFYWEYNEETYQYEEIEVSEDDAYEWSETETNVELHKIIYNGNASFQAMNLIIGGTIDVEGLWPQIDAIDYDQDEEQAVQEEIDAFNEHVNLSLRFADTDQIIAMVEAYPVSEEYTWTNWVWNESTQQYDEVEVTEMDYWMELRFVFADGSRIDFETYIDEGFEDLINELEDFIEDFEDSYGLDDWK